MLRTEKEEIVGRFEAVLKDAKGVYLADFDGMTVEVISELRKRCRESNVKFEVVKNTLMTRAANATGYEELVPYLAGPTGVAVSTEDEVVPAKVLSDFLNEFKRPAIKAGMIGSKLLSTAEVVAVAKLPSKDILISMFMRTMQSPLSDFASAITSPMRDLCGVLNALAEQKGS
jgi:large subunit ribosomal protein L10